ncbi:MAG TPA: sugar ABC transporter permease [Thermomicrobiales bacterium]|nr:sugar ABC transporter permease [Thermomicrobiales bacterium]
MATAPLPGVRELSRVARPPRRQVPLRRHLPAYLMCAPTVVLFLVFMVFPIGFVLYTSLHDWDGIRSIRQAEWVGLSNYQRLVGDAFWWTAVRNTVVYAVIKLAVELPLALVIALTLNTGLRGRTIFRTIGFLPVVTSIAVVSLAFTFFFSPLGGAFNALLIEWFGIIDRPIAFLGEREYALWTVTGVAIWHDLGINMVFFLAALQTVPRDLYEAADLDGAGTWEKFRSITIPSIRPITAIIVMLSMAGSLKVFDYFAVMTGGGPGFSSTTMVLYMFRYTSFGGGGLAGTQTIPAVGYGSTVAIGLGIVIFAAILLQQWISRWQEGR